jgi:adiponectin receptor
MVSDIRQRHPAGPNGHMAYQVSTTEDTALLNKIEKKLLIAWDDLPDWSKDNGYIRTGFRPISKSYWKCLQSCFYLHNETGNIYTHLLAALWMIALPIALYPYSRDRYPTAGADDWIVFALFFLGGASCFTLSTIYHVLSNHSHAVHDITHQLDYLGIIVVTAGCFPPGMWYTFPCVARETKIFWISVCRVPVPVNLWTLLRI